MRSSRRGLLRTAAAGSAAVAVGGGAAVGVAGCTAGPGSDDPRYVRFRGAIQAGVTAAPTPARALAASFTCVARDRSALRAMLAELTEEIESLMSGEPIEQRPAEFPPVDSGIVGATPPADNLAITVSVGASLFDERFGLADVKPRELVQMPFLANDRLDPDRSHGDVLISFEADSPDTIAFALRQVMRRTRGELVLKWMLDGYTRTVAPRGEEVQTPRNLMGFKDGTANLDPADGEDMDRYVFVAEEDDEPSWTVGGSYLAFRTIRMLVEFWDRTPLAEQEAIIGRHKGSGAPLGAEDEFTEPDMTGSTIPVDAHIRLANPRKPESEANRMLRRGFSYTRGFDDAGRLDQGLAFVSFQRSLQRGFLAVQARLTGEPLEEYILPEGGGFFFTLPGAPAGEHLGEHMFD